jgi:hypothetical protein
MSGMSGMQGMQGMAGMGHAGMSQGLSAAERFLLGESSGTAFQPEAWPMPMVMTMTGNWHLMWMGQAFVVDTQQAGPRGGDKLYSTNWGMLEAVRKAGRGAFALRTMLSLEPATITNRRYPLLFQTGETAYGVPLVDAQHPHDFVMELSVQYAREFGEKGIWDLYYAPVGDPALGPVAYPHRASAMELPQAPISHHWIDSTHIANNVVTGGVTYGKVRVEASGFHGREPDEARWNIDWGGVDSWSARVSVYPSNNWTGQVSVGRLEHPEALEPWNVVRTTASMEYARPAAGGTWWATTVAWGQNYRQMQGRRVNAALAETVVPYRRLNFFTGRFEWSQRDELLRDNPNAFDVSQFTAGYTRDIPLFRNVETGLGANVSGYAIAAGLKPYYGDHPWGVSVYLRVRLKHEAK